MLNCHLNHNKYILLYSTYIEKLIRLKSSGYYHFQKGLKVRLINN